MTQELRLDWTAAANLLPILSEFHKTIKAGHKLDLLDSAEQIAGAFGIDDIQAFIEENAQSQLADVLDANASKELAGIVGGMCKPVGTAIAQFAQGDASSRVLMDNLNDVYLNSLDGLEGILQNAVGFEIPEGVLKILEKYQLSAISIYCFAAAYKIYRKAADDAAIAKEHRIEIEKMCEESIGKLKEQRAEMEAMVNDYLLDRLLPFAEGISAMDQAVLDNDDDGYIAANAEIWKMLGREAQYSDAAGFNDLMMSDESIKL